MVKNDYYLIGYLIVNYSVKSKKEVFDSSPRRRFLLSNENYGYMTYTIMFKKFGNVLIISLLEYRQPRFMTLYNIQCSLDISPIFVQGIFWH